MRTCSWKGIVRYASILLITIFLAGCAGTRPDPSYTRDRKGGTPSSSTSKPTRPKTTPKEVKRYAGTDALAREVAEWWGTPYGFGMDRKQIGVDCSAYVRAVYRTVYGVRLPRNSSAQYQVGRPIDRRSLQRGDLVFFNTSGRGVSHVGIYLGRNKFTHASNSDGVTIDDLNSPYYSKRYVGARRVR